MKRLSATLVSCFVLLCAAVSVPALAEAKDEAATVDTSVLEDTLTNVTDGIHSVLNGVKANINELLNTSGAFSSADTQSSEEAALSASQDLSDAETVPSNISGVVWNADYTTCTIQTGTSVDGGALKSEISSHKGTLTTFVAEDNTSLTGTAQDLFKDCKSLSTLNLSSSFSTSAVTSMYGMFWGCSALTSLALPEAFTPASAFNLSYMFNECDSLVSLTLPDSFDTNGISNMNNMFTGCSALTSLTLPDNFNTSAADSLSGMFAACSSLTSLTLPDTFSLSSANNISFMFADCSALTSLSLPDAFVASSGTNLESLFQGCSSLTSLTLPDGFASADSIMLKTFAFATPGTSALKMRSLTLPKSFTMKTYSGLPGLTSQGSYKNYWTTSIDNCVNFGTTEDEAVANINSALAANAGAVTFSNVNVALSFNANGGTYATTNAAQVSTPNADEVKNLFGNSGASIPAADIPEPRLTAYALCGWSMTPDGEAADAPSAFPATDTTYYAKWVSTSIAITFDANGHGTFVDGKTNLDVDCIPGEKLTFPADDALVVEDGYTFNGWFTEASGGTQVTDQTDCPDVVTTYYAQYSEVPAPEPTPTPTPDVTPASEKTGLPLTGDTFAGLNGMVLAAIAGALVLFTGWILYRKREL